MKTLHYFYTGTLSIVGGVRDHQPGDTAMLITYIMFAISGLLGSVIAVDSMKAATRRD
ncbi:MAG: hypothetical protein WC965_14195 [Thiohalomonadaceae bacterium]